MPLERVKKFLEPYSDLEVILFDSSTHTAEMAAQTLGVTVGQIAKTLVFIAEGNPLLVVTCGDKKVNTKLLAKAIGVKKVKFADSAIVEEFTGFPPGGVSPVGLLKVLPVYLDQSLYEYDIVYAAAGTANSALPIAPERLRQITNGCVIDVCK
ncbi:YbaK/EbsC family protein [Sporolituus thermophilus]|uniref:Cys-tRNA(Pro) deacylase n=1 Tax=Sporolituus thermophilus DSM 23256 TaxID=1123285 RepID=A0A1G7I4Y6_9FIRM|nr:YbaK/EbsC family protein [Sporolituus thermophilus]SDF07409.1 Cys-tRNA(Pro) deacylase [Sporolituus thermophilus DSM 23256]